MNSFSVKKIYSKISSDSFMLYTMILVIMWSVIHDTLLSFLYNTLRLNVGIIKFALVFKDGIVGLLFIITILKMFNNYKLVKEDYFVTIFFILIFIYFFIGEASVKSKLLEARGILYPFALFYIGKSISLSKEISSKTYKIIRNVTIFIVVIGIIEYFLLPIEFWKYTINMGRFGYGVKGMGDDVAASVWGNMFTAGKRRLVGPFGDPLFMSYFMIVLLSLLIAAIIVNNKNDINKFYNSKVVLYILTLLSIICILLTISRGPIIALFLGVLSTILLLKEYKVFFRIMATVIVIAIPFYRSILNIVIKTITFNDGGSAKVHYNLLMLGIQEFGKSFLGRGLGMAGFLALKSGSEGAIHSENAYLNLGLQLGIFGVTCYLFFWCILFVKLIKKYKSLNNQIERVVLLGLSFSSVALFITGFISPQLWTIKSIILYWFLMGLYYPNKVQEPL